MCRRGGGELASSPDEETNNFLSSFHRCGQLYNTELNPLTHTQDSLYIKKISHQLQMANLDRRIQNWEDRI